ncbi:MAG: metal-sulfur cluster assembly factor [Chloroflexi bacterium]|nr:metal-sulfur cluster assembly factor [Chloroflexota bacterium]
MVVTYDDVIMALKQVIDPELGINIVDLGLVYEAQVADGDVLITMTMTTPACPLGSHLVDEATFMVQQLTDAASVDVQLVWQPAWTPMMMSLEAKQSLGWL